LHSKANKQGYPHTHTLATRHTRRVKYLYPKLKMALGQSMFGLPEADRPSMTSSNSGDTGNGGGNGAVLGAAVRLKGPICGFRGSQLEHIGFCGYS
jgi:hypothetical protein